MRKSVPSARMDVSLDKRAGAFFGTFFPLPPSLPDGEDSYLHVQVQLKQQRIRPGNSSTSFLEWWMIQLVDCQADCHILPMVIFSDKVSPPSLGFLAGYG